jgi:hypothetical protein
MVLLIVIIIMLHTSSVYHHRGLNIRIYCRNHVSLMHFPSSYYHPPPHYHDPSLLMFSVIDIVNHSLYLNSKCISKSIYGSFFLIICCWMLLKIVGSNRICYNQAQTIIMSSGETKAAAASSSGSGTGDVGITREAALRLLEIYGRAWETRDPDLILTIFTKDATYNDPKEPLNHGHEGIKRYWISKVIGEQRDIKFNLLNTWIDNSSSNGGTVIAEWHATFIDMPRNVNISMTEVAIFGVRNGLFSSLREYYKAIKTPIIDSSVTTTSTTTSSTSGATQAPATSKKPS